MPGFNVDNSQFDMLRAAVTGTLSPERAAHVLAVEKMAVRLGELYVTEADGENVLRAAALLHDITKELTAAEQIEICRTHGLTLTGTDLAAPKTFHARTAAALIPEKYPGFADSRVISAVRWHTTGKADMSIYDKLIFLADYIDDSRDYPTCVRLRRIFWDAAPAGMDVPQREAHLGRVLNTAFDLTILDIVRDGKIIHGDTVAARNFLLMSGGKNK